MAEVTKYQLVANNNIVTDFRSQFSLFRNRKSSAFVYGVVFVFIVFSIFLAFSPSSSSSSPSSWFLNIFTLNNTYPPNFPDESFRSPFSADFSSNSSQIHETDSSRSQDITATQTPMSDNLQNLTDTQLPPDKVEDFESDNSNFSTPEKPSNESSTNFPQISPQISPFSPNKVESFESNDTSFTPPEKPSNQNVTNLPQITPQISPLSPTKVESFESNDTSLTPPEKPSNQNITNLPQISPQISPPSPDKVENFETNDTYSSTPEKLNNQSSSTIMPQISPKISPLPPNKVENFKPNNATNHPEKQSNQSSIINPQISPEIPQIPTKIGNNTVSGETKKQGNEKKSMIDSLVDCDLYDGEWVRDDSYPLYEPGSCKLIDEQFNCIRNGRPDTDYQKLKWKPKGCTLPRLEGRQMLKLLRGKRLVFVGDSLNRNMWESLVCILKSAVKNPKHVYEAYGRHSFRTEASYSFVFKDYNCTIEFFVAPFLVQQWEVKDKNGTTKETLRLDLVVRDSDHFKYADVVIFNTGHWWTHEKTSKGEDYYQEGSHVYQQLDVQEAFRKAITTWGRWIDANIDPRKTHVFFRGYSSTHFRGGQWNSGGQCDSETEPIRNEAYLTKYPWKMQVLENVLKGMKTPVSYLNITKLTDYRKDAHPSVYRKQRLSTEEKRTPLKFQDCSHWCLPGVPDLWNELIYAEILRKHFLDKQTKS